MVRIVSDGKFSVYVFETMTYRWDMHKWAHMSLVRRIGRRIEVTFMNGEVVRVPAVSFIRGGVLPEEWTVTQNEPFEFVIEAPGVFREVPDEQVRRLTDREYAAWWATAAAAAARVNGQRIRELRQARKMTAKELALSAGIPSSTLSRIELGQSSAGLPTLQRILKAMGCTLGDMVVTEQIGQPLVGRAIQHPQAS